MYKRLNDLPGVEREEYLKFREDMKQQPYFFVDLSSKPRFSLPLYNPAFTGVLAQPEQKAVKVVIENESTVVKNTAAMDVEMTSDDGTTKVSKPVKAPKASNTDVDYVEYAEENNDATADTPMKVVQDGEDHADAGLDLSRV
jgi:hypothetical protein